MFSHYLTVAWRHLYRNPGYSLVNIFGLSIGLACCMLILLYVRDEIGYDRFHASADRIYRLVESGNASNRPLNVVPVPAPWGPALMQEFPEVIDVVRFRKPSSHWLIRYGENRFYERGFFIADSTVFEVFSFPLVKGNPRTALNQPHTVVLSESMARKYFGDEDPIGKILSGDGQYEFTVTGIMKDLPRNSHIHFDFLASYATLAATGLYGEPATFQNQGFAHNVYTYLLLQAGTSPDVVTQKLPAFLDKHLGDTLKNAGVVARPYLQPLTRIHLYSDLDGELEENGDIRYVYGFSLLALVILLIACINFMNLSTARSAHRAREVGMRKVVGAQRIQLIRQFMGESVLITGIAFLFGIILVHLLLPTFNSLSGRSIDIQYQDMWTFAGAIGLILMVGALSGSYPALVLSSFRPVAVLQGTPRMGAANATLRKGLVVVQFALSITLISGTLVVTGQLRYLREKGLGFNRDNVVVIRLPDRQTMQQYPVLKQALTQHPEIANVSTASNAPGGLITAMTIRPEGVPATATPVYNFLIVEPDFIETLEIPLVSGRNFSPEFTADADGVCLINEALARDLNWDDPLDKTLTDSRGQAFRIIGVVRDFHVKSLHHKIEPLILLTSPVMPVLFVRIRTTNVKGALNLLRREWQAAFPAYPELNYSFLDQDFNRLYQAEERLNTVLFSFSVLSIVIACLGLFGLTSFVTQKRTRELGVRKVLGASVTDILRLLMREFTGLVAVAFLIAAPASVFLLQRWLQGFEYRIAINPWDFVIAGAGALAIGWATIGYHAHKAARLNPVDALRYE